MSEGNVIPAILVVDDEESVRFVLLRGLKKPSRALDSAETATQAARMIAEREYDIVFLDINMPGGSGFDLFDSLPQGPAAPSVVVMTAQATMHNAVTAMRKGAFDYITKPFDIDMVEILVERILQYRAMSRELGQLRSSKAAAEMDEMAGQSAAMQKLYKFIGRAADSSDTVLITGPTGSGKELVARALHFHSRRAAAPFVTVNCAAVPGELLESEMFGHVKGAFTGAVESRDGKFAAAGDGSILLDEIGDMPISLQVKMLRALQEREYYPVGSSRPRKTNARVIASTNKNLEEETAAGRFREDLYHRLNVLSIQAPSLDERKEDIPILTEVFLARAARTLGERPKRISPEAVAALMARSWPGNVRELENAVRRAVALAPADAVMPEDFPWRAKGATASEPGQASGGLEQALSAIYDSAPAGAIHKTALEMVEKSLIQKAMKRAGGVQSKAAEELGLNRNTLAKKIAELGIGKGGGKQ
ncbi:MAG: sigma-54 dependent transcriptional regulator [Nitrospinota bacterium]|nr:sigma-54 dependent transcriptional regulator [Nitrospinota bacterium]